MEANGEIFLNSSPSINLKQRSSYVADDTTGCQLIKLSLGSHLSLSSVSLFRAFLRYIFFRLITLHHLTSLLELTFNSSLNFVSFLTTFILRSVSTLSYKTISKKLTGNESVLVKLSNVTTK